MERPNIKPPYQPAASAVAFVDATAATDAAAELLTTRVCGEELFLHAAHAATAAGSVARTVVVSNNAGIIQIAKQNNFESLRLADSNYTVPVIDRVFKSLDVAAAGLEMLTVALAATFPLISSEDIDRFVAKASKNQNSAVFAPVECARREFVDSGALYAFSRVAMQRVGSLAALQLSPEALPAFHAVRVRDLVDLNSLAALIKREPLAAILRKRPMSALVLDFDGVFTDNKVIVSADGLESAICDRSDGFAIQALQRRGFPILVLSTEKVPIVRVRSEKLGLQCIHGLGDKRSVLTKWLKEKNIDPQQTIYVGNDVNDLECMGMVGLPIAVADAFPEVLGAARYVLRSRGGHGAIREIATAVAAALDRQD